MARSAAGGPNGRPGRGSGLTPVEGGVLGGMLAGILAALLLVARNDLVPVERPFPFALVFLGWHVLFYVVAALAVALLAHVLPAPRRVLAVALLLYLAAVLWGGRQVIPVMFALEGPRHFRWLLPGAFVLGVAAMVVVAARLAGRAVPARTLALLAGLAALGALIPARASPVADVSSAPASAPGSARRLLLVGVDGASWPYLDALMARGELAHFASLKARGAWGPLKSFVPTRSPIIWTTIATGKPPAQHGVLGFMEDHLRGVRDVLPPLAPGGAPGSEWTRRLLRRAGQIFETPVTSASRRVPAFWNIASRHGSRVCVVHWWATWPAEPVHGAIVSELPITRPRDRAPARGLTYPEGLHPEIAGRALAQGHVSWDQARRFVDLTPQDFDDLKAPPAVLEGTRWLAHYISLFETTRQQSLFLMERTRARYGQPSDMFVLFRLVDMCSHTFMRYSELVEDHLGAAPEEVGKYGRAVSEAYRQTDRVLGELIQAFGPGSVVVVSDHGFGLEGSGPYGHDLAPDGVFLAAGPAFRPGRVDGLSVYDVLPLLLYLKGFAVADDLAGRVPRAALADDYWRENPPARVATYGRRRGVSDEVVAAAVDEEVRARLRALGYVQ